MAPSHDPTWDALQYLLAVGRHGTFSAAARALRVNHTTVARHVRLLEERFGVSLIVPAASGYVLTAAGDELVATAKRVEDEVDEVGRRLLGRDAQLSGSVRVTTFDVMAAALCPSFQAFAREHPEIQLEISVSKVPRSLTRREADVAIRATAAPPDNLVGHKVYRCEYALYGHLSHAESGQPLEALPWLGWDPVVEAILTDRWMREHVPNARIVMVIDTLDMMFRAVSQGIGVQFLPCFYGDERPELRRLRPVEPGFGVDIWILTPKELRRTARVRALVAHLKRSFAAFPQPS